MRHEIDQLLERCGRVATRQKLLSIVTRNQLDHEIAAGYLVAVFPRTYCRPWDVDESAVRERAALLSVGKPVLLSHLTALRRSELPAPDCEQIHVTTTFRRHPGRPIQSVPGLVVHRTRLPVQGHQVDGLPTVPLSLAIVRSWPLMPGRDQRAPAIKAVRDNLVTPDELRATISRAVGMPGRSQLDALVALLEAGCESELELWGHTQVFDVPGLDHAVTQKKIQIRGMRYRLDRAYEEERVAVEMDGDTYHSSKEQRERDRRRDTALASIGWISMRFSHDRLRGDVAGVRRETLATLAARRYRSA